MRLKGSVRQINLLSLFFLLNLNFVISTRIAKLAPVLTRQNSIRVQGIFFGVHISTLDSLSTKLNFEIIKKNNNDCLVYMLTNLQSESISSPNKYL